MELNTKTANFPGRCPLCKRAIKLGDTLKLSDVPGRTVMLWVHKDCYVPPRKDQNVQA